MALEPILEHILNEAKAESEKIIRQTKIEAEGIIKQAASEADNLYQALAAQDEAIYEHQKQSAIVNARLVSKNNYLRAKQQMLDAVFAKIKAHLGEGEFKKQQVCPDKTKEVPQDIDFYLSRVRPDYETEIAKILFD